MEITDISKTFSRDTRHSVVTCVISLLQYYDISINQNDLKEKIVINDKGEATLSDITKTFERFGLFAEGFRANAVSNLDELLNPAIIPVCFDDGREDFAIYYGKYEKRYLIGMPFWGLNLYTEWEIEAIWINHILLEVKRYLQETAKKVQNKTG